jgi:hypothetical protein
MPFDLVRQSAVIVVPLRHVRRLCAHFGVELAVVAHFDLGEEFRLLSDQVAEFPQQRAALRSIQLRPLAGGERLVRRAHRAVCILRAASGNERPGLAGERVVAGESIAGSGLHPFAADEHLVLGQGAGSGIHITPSKAGAWRLGIRD